jgi:hypothetical protein
MLWNKHLPSKPKDSILQSHFWLEPNVVELSITWSRKESLLPSRSWLNDYAKAFNLSLKFCRRIPRDRLCNGTRAKVSSFFEKFEQLMWSFPRELVVGADETMINMNKAHEAFVEIGVTGTSLWFGAWVCCSIRELRGANYSVQDSNMLLCKWALFRRFLDPSLNQSWKNGSSSRTGRTCFQESQKLSFLVDKLNAGFLPGTERLNGSIRHMLEYDLKEPWTLEDCVRYLFDGMDERAKTPITIAECPSMKVMQSRNRELPSIDVVQYFTLISCS